MKRLVVLSLAVVLPLLTADAQSNFKEHKAGHVFHINLPDYMTKTVGLNSASSIQYKSVVKDVYGFVIIDTKEELALADMNYSSINEFYDSFITGFLADEEKRNISKPKYQKKGDISFAETDAVYYDKEAKLEIYYLVGIVETKSSFYKVLSWSSVENKEKFKPDFQKILYSLKD